MTFFRDVSLDPEGGEDLRRGIQGFTVSYNGSVDGGIMGSNDSTLDPPEIFCGYIPDTESISVIIIIIMLIINRKNVQCIINSTNGLLFNIQCLYFSTCKYSENIIKYII